LSRPQPRGTRSRRAVATRERNRYRLRGVARARPRPQGAPPRARFAVLACAPIGGKAADGAPRCARQMLWCPPARKLLLPLVAVRRVTCALRVPALAFGSAPSKKQTVCVSNGRPLTAGEGVHPLREKRAPPFAVPPSICRRVRTRTRAKRRRRPRRRRLGVRGSSVDLSAGAYQNARQTSPSRRHRFP